MEKHERSAVATIVTTCKGRLHHLEKSLPTMVAQADCEVVVVDYDCPQGTAEWVRARFPAVRVVEVRDDPIFCAARARNRGAAQARTPWLFFVDADVMLRSDLGSWIRERADERKSYAHNVPKDLSLHGTLLCPTRVFEDLGGYDEAFRGWGGEDSELRLRLALAGLAPTDLPTGALVEIPHGDEERQLSTQSGGAGDKINQLILTQLYTCAKHDIERLSGSPLGPEARRKIMEHARAAVLRFPRKRGEQRSGGSLTFALPKALGPGIARPAVLTSKLVYEF